MTETARLQRAAEKGTLTFIACLACTVILPVYVHYLPPFMILWGLFWLVENRNDLGERFAWKSSVVLLLLFAGFFIWQISGLLFADSVDTGLERLFKRLSLLLFPLVLFYPGKKITENINLILRLFAIATFAYVVYCYCNALNHSLIITSNKWFFNPHPLEYDYENYFTRARLSDLVHPSYLSMYLIISILISLEATLEPAAGLKKRVLWAFVAVFFLVTVFLLSARAAILATVVVLPGYFLYKFYHKLSKWHFLAILAIFITLIILVAKTNSKINYSFGESSSVSIDKAFARDERSFIWKSAFGVIKNHILVGVGTGDASEELKREFKNRGFSQGYYDNLNAHNQFIEIQLENGLVGLLLFLSIIAFIVLTALRQENALLLLFVITMIIFFNFETVLNRLAGITFFPFFVFLLLHTKSKQLE